MPPKSLYKKLQERETGMRQIRRTDMMSEKASQTEPTAPVITMSRVYQEPINSRQRNVGIQPERISLRGDFLQNYLEAFETLNLNPIMD